MTEDEFITIVAVDRQTLAVWIESGWLRPQVAAASRIYSDADVARAGLVADLGGPMGVNAEGIGIILDLIDQLHGLRSVVEAFGKTYNAQPEDVQERFRFVARRLHHPVREL